MGQGKCIVNAKVLRQKRTWHTQKCQEPRVAGLEQLNRDVCVVATRKVEEGLQGPEPKKGQEQGSL